MNQSFKIGSVFGITVRVHAMLLILIGIVLLGAENLFQALVMIGTLIVTVFLHELGHGLMAQRHGLKVLDITFWPMGGLARMSEIPQDWRVESQIAFAGPAVNLALAALAAPIAFVFGGTGGIASFAFYFFAINLALGLFNLIPAFPMDGARVMRSLLARKMDWLEATEKTASIGRSGATLLAIGGMLFTIPFFNFLGCFFSLGFAAWIWWSCTQEVILVRMRNMRSAFEGAAGGAGSGATGPFGSAGPFGIFSRAGGPFRADPRAPQAEVQRPAKGGFSEKDIEDLEKFRGTLRNRKPKPD